MIFRKCMQQLSLLDFDIRNIESQSTIFAENSIVDYSNTGRKQNLFHLITSGKRTYYIDNIMFEVSENQVLFIPHGTVYKTKAHNANEEQCSGIGVVFDAGFDDDTNVALSKKIYYMDSDAKTKQLFEKIYLVSNHHPIIVTKLKSLLLDLISHMANDNDNKMKVVLKPALDCFAVTFKENLPIRFYAEQCNLSESYFRKIFREAIGMSPISYRNELRFAEAESLYFLHHNIDRAATEVGFCDEGFFTKLYKKRFGVSMKNIDKIV